MQLTASGKATLIPVTILVNGKFYDATAYKANPVPMALESGTVYEGEHTGNSLGLFTVGSALHSNSVAVQSPWLGTGLWRPAGTEIANKPHAAESVPVGIDTSDGPPAIEQGREQRPNPAAPCEFGAVIFNFSNRSVLANFFGTAFRGRTTAAQQGFAAAEWDGWKFGVESECSEFARAEGCRHETVGRQDFRCKANRQ